MKEQKGFTILELVIVILGTGLAVVLFFLKMIDPALFTDPFGSNLGTSGSSYSYEAANCESGKCQEYILKSTMEKEDTYVKHSREN